MMLKYVVRGKQRGRIIERLIEGETEKEKELVTEMKGGRKVGK